jgi:hypothetical protein
VLTPASELLFGGVFLTTRGCGTPGSCPPASGVAADDYIYGARLEDATLGVDSKKTQNDVQLAAGLGVPLSGH